MLAKAAALRSKGARALEARSMPSTLGDKVLSAFMRNGQALCGAFQIGRCSRTEQQCRGLHKCAVVLKSARVCGGRHPACECHDKRFLHAGDNKAAERVPKPEEVPRSAVHRSLPELCILSMVSSVKANMGGATTMAGPPSDLLPLLPSGALRSCSSQPKRPLLESHFREAKARPGAGVDEEWI